MSVFTQISEPMLTEYLARFELGSLDSFQGISSGIENTNYFVDVGRTRYVLTLVEQFELQQSRWFVDLIGLICARGFPVPTPIKTRAGECLTMLAGRPSVLCTFMPGQPVDKVNSDVLFQLGGCVARLHTITRDYPHRHPQFRDLHWCDRCYRSIHQYLNQQQRLAIEEELKAQQATGAVDLPVGAIHADLFRDNVFFNDNHLQGIIDFWHSGVDNFVYELAVICNDWCWQDNQYHSGHIEALLAGYRDQRQISPAECSQWGMALRRAALRFWLSRLKDTHLSRKGSITHQKNPDEQKQRLDFLLDHKILHLDDLL